MIPLKWRYRAVGGMLILTFLVGINAAIFFSSKQHFHDMGWAIFCGVNALWLGALGVLVLVYSESHDVAMRQLDLDAEREGMAA